MLKIQEGCNQVCAYCIVPKVQGRESSIPPDTLVQQVRRRVEEGYAEVVLTGTQLGSYGFDLESTDLRRLIQRILAETRVARLRVSSIQPQELSSQLLELWHDPRLCPHFHIPLRSGSDSVLKRMRRRYSTSLYARMVDLIRATVAGASVTADIIVGFPGETEEEFRESLEFARATGFASMHVFAYSVRPGTGAAHMGPQVEPRAKRSRMNEMLALSEEMERDFVGQSLGDVRPVLWERAALLCGREVYMGLTDNYLKAVTESPMDLTNRITPALLVRPTEGGIYARPRGMPEGNRTGER